MKRLSSFRFGRTPQDSQTAEQAGAQLRKKVLDTKLQQGIITRDEHNHFIALERANAALEGETYEPPPAPGLARKSSMLLAIPQMMKRTSSFKSGHRDSQSSDSTAALEAIQAKKRAEALAFGQNLLSDVDERIAKGKPIQMITQVFQERERPQARMSITIQSRKVSGRVWKPVFIVLRHDRVGIYKDVKKLTGEEGSGFNASKEHTVYLLADIQRARMEKWEHATAGERGGLIIQFKAGESSSEGQTWELQLESTEAACAVLRAIKHNMRMLALARASALKGAYSRSSAGAVGPRALSRSNTGPSSDKPRTLSRSRTAGAILGGTSEGAMEPSAHLNDAAVVTALKGSPQPKQRSPQRSPQQPPQRRGSALIAEQGRRASLRLVEQGVHPDITTATRRLSQEGRQLAQQVALLQANVQPVQQASPPRPAPPADYAAAVSAAAKDFVMQLPTAAPTRRQHGSNGVPRGHPRA
jgi:hypothetical protein